MNTVRVIVTDTGEYAPSAELNAIFNEAKLRKDGQPDRRTRAGKRWGLAFNAFSDEKLTEYLAS